MTITRYTCHHCLEHYVVIICETGKGSERSLPYNMSKHKNLNSYNPSYLLKETIPNVTRIHGVKNRAMFAARSLLQMIGLLLFTGRQLKGQPFTKIHRIIPWYYHNRLKRFFKTGLILENYHTEKLLLSSTFKLFLLFSVEILTG